MAESFTSTNVKISRRYLARDTRDGLRPSGTWFGQVQGTGTASGGLATTQLQCPVNLGKSYLWSLEEAFFRVVVTGTPVAPDIMWLLSTLDPLIASVANVDWMMPAVPNSISETLTNGASVSHVSRYGGSGGGDNAANRSHIAPPTWIWRPEPTTIAWVMTVEALNAPAVSYELIASGYVWDRGLVDQGHAPIRDP